MKITLDAESARESIKIDIGACETSALESRTCNLISRCAMPIL